MNTAAATAATPGAIKATPNPTCYTRAHPIDLSGAGTLNFKDQEPSHVLLLYYLRGIAAFCWAASRRTLERMLLTYLLSAVNPTLRSLIANLTAIARGGGGGVPTSASAEEAAEEAQALNDKEVSVICQAGGACVNSKKVSWNYMRGAFSRAFIRCSVIDLLNEGRNAVV
jgi:hypothetical protein